MRRGPAGASGCPEMAWTGSNFGSGDRRRDGGGLHVSQYGGITARTGWLPTFSASVWSAPGIGLRCGRPGILRGCSVPDAASEGREHGPGFRKGTGMLTASPAS